MKRVQLADEYMSGAVSGLPGASSNSSAGARLGLATTQQVHQLKPGVRFSICPAATARLLLTPIPRWLLPCLQALAGATGSSLPEGYRAR